MIVSTTLREAVAVLEIDNPPINALSASVAEALASSLDAAGCDAAVLAIVIAAAGKTFVAGADLKELERAVWSDPRTAPELHAVLAHIEDCCKPVVMALHGNVLGGGLELAMAGHYRVAAEGTQLGQPEVQLGIIPGAEGTQRLPRLVGIELALQMCVSGKPIDARGAERAGLVDKVVTGDVTSDAVIFASTVIATGSRRPKTRERADHVVSADKLAELLQAARATAQQTRRNQVAPLAVIDALEAAATMSFADGCKRERALFVEVAGGTQAKALIHAFFAERAVARTASLSPTAKARSIARVAVVGAGTMGRGIAIACANAGLHVHLSDTDPGALAVARTAIEEVYERSVARGRISEKERARRLEQIELTTDCAGWSDADIAIEAVFESMSLKKDVMSKLDRATRPGCVLATNTSTLDIDALASATSRPESVVGMHFFSPAHVMRLVEIVRGQATAPDVIAIALDISRRLRKVGVVVGNGPGFAGNRMMFPYMYEAQFLVEEGATPLQVDRALTTFGMAMGIFEVDDMAGLDVAKRVKDELGHFRSEGIRRPLVADLLHGMGRMGQKSGKGWYSYGPDRKPAVDPEVTSLIEHTARAAGIRQRTFTDQEIIERTVYSLINEGARVLEDGIAQRASDLDVIYLTGYGFPSYRGGPMMYGDLVGLKTIHDRLIAFRQQLGDRWQPAPLLARLANAGMTFRQFDAERAGQES